MTNHPVIISQRKDFQFFINIDTRWMDNDIYGHVNNVVYYSFFDTIVNTYLIEHAYLDIHSGEVIGLMVNSSCNYHSSIKFPDKLVGGLSVTKVGNSSVCYKIAIFKQNEDTASADGNMTHVFVNRETNKPTLIIGELKEALLQALLVSKK